MFQRLILAAVGAITLASAATALHASDEYVYVESNIKTPNGNSIYAFHRQANGVLQPIHGFPFLTGGAGTQYADVNVGPQDSDQEIITNSDRSLLFAVNSGSDTIAVFHIQSDGSLKPVDGSPFPSGGTDPVSLALRSNILFVVNKNGDFPRLSTSNPNYTTLRVERDGFLVPRSMHGPTAHP
jgi:6-phosphogluconolactonase (cycloisomerase 2 family)